MTNLGTDFLTILYFYKSLKTLRTIYSKTCLKGSLSKRPKLVFKTKYRLMQVESIAECSKGSILQYFRPSLSCHLSLRSLFCLFLSGHFTLILLHRSHDNKTIIFVPLEIRIACKLTRISSLFF